MASSPIVLPRSLGGMPVRPVTEVEAGVRIGVYGPGGSGKTTWIASALDSEFGGPMLYLNARGNPEVARSRGDQLQVIDLPNFKAQEAIRQDLLRGGPNGFKSVAIDNVSELHSMSLRDRYGTGTDITWTMHSGSTADVLAMVRNWCDVAVIPSLRLNVFFVLWETPEKRTIRGVEVDRSELALNKALQAQIPGILSWLGRMYIAEGPPNYTRVLDFRPIEREQISKWQVDPNDERTKGIPMEQWNPSLGSILDAVKGGKPWPTQKHSRPVRAGTAPTQPSTTATPAS